jgi:hypothetical protein
MLPLNANKYAPAAEVHYLPTLKLLRRKNKKGSILFNAMDVNKETPFKASLKINCKL